MLTVGLHGIEGSTTNHHAHDHAIALMRDGVVLANLEVERFSRIKHDANLAMYFDNLIKPWLQEGETVRFVLATSFFGNKFQSESNSCDIVIPAQFEISSLFAQSSIAISSFLANHPVEAWCVSHEAAHVGSCLPFFGDYKDNSLLIHIDGGASVSSTSVWYFSKNTLKLLFFDWKTLKQVVNYFNDSEISRLILGLQPSDHLSMPGKLMGYAAHGMATPELIEQIKSLKTNTEKQLFVERHCASFKATLKADSFCAHIAASMQKDFEISILNFIKKWKSETGAKTLYYSGGAALNIPTNTRIESELGFQHFYIPPVSSDVGLSLGAAALFEWHSGNSIVKTDPFLNRTTLWEMPLIPQDRIYAVANMIASNQVIATCIGAAESGPRALGHRSILSTVDNIPVRTRVSETMKQREWYRPVAPIILPNVAEKVLVDFKETTTLTAYMLGAWRVKDEFQHLFKGVIHVDGTVRAQVVRSTDHSLQPIYQLLQILLKKFSIYGLINTSFNQRGEPIVQTVQEARLAAKMMNIDALWIELENESSLEVYNKFSQQEARQ